MKDCGQAARPQSGRSAEGGSTAPPRFFSALAREDARLTAAALLTIVLTTGALPCQSCGPEGQPTRTALIYRRACDGGKCNGCFRPLYGGPSAPPFNFRLVFNYPWSQVPACPPSAQGTHLQMPHVSPEPIETGPMAPASDMPAPGTAARNGASRRQLRQPETLQLSTSPRRMKAADESHDAPAVYTSRLAQPVGLQTR